MPTAPSGSHATALSEQEFLPSCARVVGLAGLAGCGKSTVAAYLAERGYTRIRFADPLKKALRAIGCTDAEIEGHLKQVPCDLLCGQTPRFAMQTIGTEWGRNTIGQDLWVNAWRRAVDALPLTSRIVAEDVRFPNEVGAVHRCGGLIFHIERPGQERIATSGHASETSFSTYDAKIINDGTLDDLYRAVDACIIRGEVARAA